MNLPRPIRIIGVGSPQGDDAVAWRVVEKLQEDVGAVQGVEFYRVDGGQRLLDLLDDRGSAVILDAAETIDAPGSLTRFNWPNDQLAGLRPGTTHDLDIDAALRLAEALKALPQSVVVYAIAAESFDPGDDLSPSLATVVPALAKRLGSELGLVNQEAVSCTNPRS